MAKAVSISTMKVGSSTQPASSVRAGWRRNKTASAKVIVVSANKRQVSSTDELVADEGECVMKFMINEAAKQRFKGRPVPLFQTAGDDSGRNGESAQNNPNTGNQLIQRDSTQPKASRKVGTFTEDKARLLRKQLRASEGCRRSAMYHSPIASHLAEADI